MSKKLKLSSVDASPLTLETKSPIIPQNNGALMLLASLCVPPDNKDNPAYGRETHRVCESRLTVSPSMITTFRSVFQPGRTFRFRTIRCASITASAGGAMLLSTSIYPGNMSEYAQLSALFDECRLHATRIRYVFLTPTGGPNAFVSAFSPTNGSGTPASATAAFQIPGAKIFNTWNTVGNNSELSNSWTVKQPRPWSASTASVTGVDPVGGIIGSWYHALFSNVSGAVIVADYFIECDYEFRNPI
jgi:hypothetical protein